MELMFFFSGGKELSWEIVQLLQGWFLKEFSMYKQFFLTIILKYETEYDMKNQADQGGLFLHFPVITFGFILERFNQFN